MCSKRNTYNGKSQAIETNNTSNIQQKYTAEPTSKPQSKPRQSEPQNRSKQKHSQINLETAAEVTAERWSELQVEPTHKPNPKLRLNEAQATCKTALQLKRTTEITTKNGHNEKCKIHEHKIVKHINTNNNIF